MKSSIKLILFNLLSPYIAGLDNMLNTSDVRIDNGKRAIRKFMHARRVLTPEKKDQPIKGYRIKTSPPQEIGEYLERPLHTEPPQLTQTLIIHFCELQRMVDPKMVKLKELQSPPKRTYSRSFSQTPSKSATSDLAASALKYGNSAKRQKEFEQERTEQIRRYGTSSPSPMRLELPQKPYNPFWYNHDKKYPRRGSRRDSRDAAFSPAAKKSFRKSDTHSERSAGTKSIHHHSPFSGNAAKDTESSEERLLGYDDVILVPRYVDQPEIVLKSAMPSDEILEKETKTLRIWQKNVEIEDRKEIEKNRSVFPVSQWISTQKVSKVSEPKLGVLYLRILLAHGCTLWKIR